MRWALGLQSFLGWGPQPGAVAHSLWEAHVPALLCSWIFCDCRPPPPMTLRTPPQITWHFPVSVWEFGS